MHCRHYTRSLRGSDGRRGERGRKDGGAAGLACLLVSPRPESVCLWLMRGQSFFGDICGLAVTGSALDRHVRLTRDQEILRSAPLSIQQLWRADAVGPAVAPFVRRGSHGTSAGGCGRRICTRPRRTAPSCPSRVPRHRVLLSFLLSRLFGSLLLRPRSEEGGRSPPSLPPLLGQRFRATSSNGRARVRTRGCSDFPTPSASLLHVCM